MRVEATPLESVTSILRPASLPPYKRRRRARILSAAIDLMHEGGSYESIQMRDVAERSGLALATLYRYLPSKELLYAAALVQWASDFFQQTRTSVSESGSDEERLRKIYRRAVSSLERWPQMVRAQFLLDSSTDPRVRELLDEFFHQYTVAVESGVRDLSHEALDDIFMVVNGVYYYSVRRWANGQRTIREVERDVLRALELCFVAVRTEQCSANQERGQARPRLRSGRPS